MCQYLDPASFMANVFAACPGQSMDLAVLRQVRDHVTETLADRNIVIEWTRDSVPGAMECYPNLFVKRDREVSWMGSNDREYIKRHFDVEFPDDFVDALWTTIQEGCTQSVREHGYPSRPSGA